MDEELQNQILSELIREHREKPHAGLDGAALRLHITLHAVAETQLRQQTPPLVRQTYDRLQAEGLPPHEAMHAICSVVASEFSQVMGERVQYDEQRYAEKLRALTAAAWTSSTQRI